MSEHERPDEGDDWCDLEPGKRCDNCMKCLFGEADWRAIAVDGFALPQELTDDGNGDA
ncbi:MAG: hypothetical protein IKP40_08300 [Clostridia bacterium]|nr:hypothetical protein [Clostridia bacterium]